jgi:RNA polymerase sigma factor (sigma-70 family)
MANTPVGTFVRGLAQGMAKEMLANLSDAELVEKAITSQNESALEVIIHRHASMVFRVCWRATQHQEDAEDAFQATFLILARQLHTLRKYASLASWLHGVAFRVSLRAKRQAKTRSRQEREAVVSEMKMPEEIPWGELREVLDRELATTADKWRLPLILCYLEGRTQDEAAEQLKWSKGTLRRRLEEAREVLARRLSTQLLWQAF